MIDTIACCGKSTGEKILPPHLFKEAMVKFCFLVTNLTFQESDSSLAERWAEKHSFLEAPKSQIRLGTSLDALWPVWYPGQVAPGAEVGGARQERGGESWQVTPWLAQQGDKWSLSDYFGETATDSCTAWLSAQARCISFLLVWSYLLWQTSSGDHPSFDNLENDCVGRREEKEREREREREREGVRIENVFSMHLERFYS